jgi:soluble lytic murein transglycosylase-like protein
MKRVFILTLFIFLLGVEGLSKSQTSTYYILRHSYPWLTPTLYVLIAYCSEKNRISKHITCAIIQTESGGENIVAGPNSDGTYDYGYMGINEVHYPEEPEIFLDPYTNINKGTAYYSECLKKSRGDIKVAAFYYNRGKNKKLKYYKITDSYANKIKQYYLYTKILERRLNG